MTDLETQIKAMREQLEHLTEEVRQLRATSPQSAQSAQSYDSLPFDAVVGKDYVAFRFGCSIRAVQNGERGTRNIPRVSVCPLKFLKADVDREFRKIEKKPVRARAAEIRAAAEQKPKKRLLSILGKNKQEKVTEKSI